MRKYTKWILEAWTVWALLRRMGFQSDNITWEFAMTANAYPVRGMALNILLEEPGRTFRWTCSHSLTLEEAEKLRDEAAVFQQEIVNGSFSDDEMDEVARSTDAWAHALQLARGLQSKGFTIPLTDPYN